MKGKNSAENLLLTMMKLDPIEFLGICKIIGVDIYTTEIDAEEEDIKATLKPREFGEIWIDVCDTIDGFNRTKRRNLGKLIYAATQNKEE